MVEFGGSAILKAANSGTLTVEIRLSPDAPLQELLASTNAGAHVVQSADSATVRIQARGSIISSGHVQPGLVKLIPVESKTGNESSWLKLIVDAVSIPYYVVWTGVGILTFLGLLQPHIKDIKEAVTGFNVSFEQLVERVTKTLNAEQPQPTPKNEQPEKSGDPSAIPSEGD
jgi:hypothetical protein